MNNIKKPEITFIRGNCGRLWGCKDGMLSGPIVTMGDMIFEKERRKEWMRRNKQENCEMDHKCFQDFINCHEWTFAKTYYGGSLHHRSHGESFLVLAEDMFKRDGLYILDEPEAALSPRGIIRLMQRMNELVAQDCQFIISTHSPMLLCFPDAEVYLITKNGIDSVRFQDTDHYRTTVRFLQNPESAVADILGYETEE